MKSLLENFRAAQILHGRLLRKGITQGVCSQVVMRAFGEVTSGTAKSIFHLGQDVEGRKIQTSLKMRIGKSLDEGMAEVLMQHPRLVVEHIGKKHKNAIMSNPFDGKRHVGMVLEVGDVQNPQDSHMVSIISRRHFTGSFGRLLRKNEMDVKVDAMSQNTIDPISVGQATTFVNDHLAKGNVINVLYIQKKKR